MTTICPLCHLGGHRVEMNQTFLRNENRVIEVPCDVYPDGTVISQVERTSEAAVFEFECPACGLAVEWQNPPEVPCAPETP
jgi:hypothetical protein